MQAEIIQGDVLDGLRSLPAESVQTCVTSPPYYGLRDYGTAASSRCATAGASSAPNSIPNTSAWPSNGSASRPQ